jgi:mannitol-specific phosphotransferase system IIBC component
VVLSFFLEFFLILKSKKNASCFRAATEKAKKTKKKEKNQKKPKEKKEKKKEKRKKEKKNADCGYRGARPSGRWCVEVCASERCVGRGAGGGARV